MTGNHFVLEYVYYEAPIPVVDHSYPNLIGQTNIIPSRDHDVSCVTGQDSVKSKCTSPGQKLAEPGSITKVG